MEAISVLSREWIPYWVRGATGGETVEIAFTGPGAKPEVGDWHQAEWAPGSVTGKGAVARILLGPGGVVALAEGTYAAWVRITAPVELPVLPAGLIDVI